MDVSQFVMTGPCWAAILEVNSNSNLGGIKPPVLLLVSWVLYRTVDKAAPLNKIIAGEVKTWHLICE